MKLTPSDPDLQTIVARIKNGDLDLQPDFQRGEVWSISKKRRLIDSILRDWHVPPVHVVVEKDGRQVVLDGQQRLVSIRDFVRGEFSVDGSIEPYDANIHSLDRLHYLELPAEIRRAFDQFTIRVYRLTDYSPEEPGELFYRLNQGAWLTAAEQRNAFFGPVRDQIRDLVQNLESEDTTNLIGFSNRRMAFDDVLAKFLCSFEYGTLARKLTAGDISNRFRSGQPFSGKNVALAQDAIRLLLTLASETPEPTKFNKATLFTWLVFLSFFVRSNGLPDHQKSKLSNFFEDFEALKSAFTQGYEGLLVERGQITIGSYERSLLRTYIDRSTSRVSDTSSVILRDFVLWASLYSMEGARAALDVLPEHRAALLKSIVESERAAHPEALSTEELDSWGRLE